MGEIVEFGLRQGGYQNEIRRAGLHIRAIGALDELVTQALRGHSVLGKLLVLSLLGPGIQESDPQLCS
jgi:hypothetical protein